MSSDDLTSHLLGDDEAGVEYDGEEKYEHSSSWRRRQTQNVLRRHRSGLMCGSIALNIVQSVIIILLAVVSYAWRPSHEPESRVSKFAGLKEDSRHVLWDQSSVYTSDNNTAADIAWDSINHDSGIVAVPKEWALEKGLPLGSTFPWDNTKTIYFVNAYHGLHCLKNIYRSIMEFRQGRPQSLEYHHITHCLDQLRADVQCRADDTLRVTTPDMRPVTGEGQVRSCRSWDALEAWTLQNQGCYRYGNPEVEDAKLTQLPRMRYCRDGTPEMERVRQYFGKGADWRPAEEERVWSWFDADNASTGTDL